MQDMLQLFQLPLRAAPGQSARTSAAGHFFDFLEKITISTRFK